jgi:ABC-type transporter Mla MlaB component
MQRLAGSAQTARFPPALEAIDNARRPPWVVLMTQNVATTGRLVLDGALTMRTVEALCVTLQETVARHADLSIDCAAATEVDLCFIQLLIASRATALQSDRTVALAARPDGALLSALTRAGFRVTQDDQTGEAPAFWFEGAAA